MHLTASLDAPCSVGELFSWVDDLSRYPAWLQLVGAATAAPAADGSEGWLVELRGRLGPFSRAKRLRMVRTHLEPDHLVRFERRELVDGRRHSPWTLVAAVSGNDTSSHLEMQLHYGGALWGPVLEQLLRSEIEKGRRRLIELVSEPRR